MLIIVLTCGLLYLNETIHGKFSGYLSISEIPLSAPCWLPAALYSIFTKKWIWAQAVLGYSSSFTAE